MFRLHAFRALNDQRGDVVAFSLKRVGDDDLRGPPVAIVRNQFPDEGVAALVAAHGLEDRPDVFDDRLDAEGFSDQPAEAQAFRIGIVFRHEQAEDVLGADRAHRKRHGNAGVDAARKPEHQTALLHGAQLSAQGGNDAIGLGRVVDCQGFGRKRAIAPGCSDVHCAGSIVSAASRRLTLPVSVFGSSVRNSMIFGTMKSSRWRVQWRMMSLSVKSGSVRTTRAAIAWPRTGSGMPMTTASAMPGWAWSTVSTSLGATFSPRVLMISSLRPTK